MKLPQTLFAAALLLCACAAPAAQRTFDLRAPAIAPAPTAGEDGAAAAPGGLLRAAEAPAADAGALAPGDAVTLLLFDGERLDLVVEEASPATISGARAFLARTAGSEFRDAVILADSDGRLHASVSGYGDGNVLRVFPRGGATAVEESEPEPIEEGDVPAVPEPEAEPAPAADGGEELPSATQQCDVIVDVLVGYELGAKEYSAINGGPTNFAETAVQQMNLALANSELDGYYRFRLVGVMYIDDRETDLYKALNFCGHGEWGAAMRAARDECGADVVSILVDTGSSSGVCGLGNALTSTNAQRAAQFRDGAYNVCAVRSVLKSHTMTHEVGHNLGCGHSNEPTAVQPGPQSFPWSSGYHFVGSDGRNYHTIMAYDYLDGTFYSPVSVFSSPLLTRAGVPAGTAESNDNRRVLTQSGLWASNWRDAVTPLSYDVFFTPGTGTPITDGSLSVSLEAGRSGLEIRYTTDGSAPTLSSPVYSGPIKLTATTTIRAAAVYGGVLGPVATARYFVPDLAEALDTPGLVWTTSNSSGWTFQMTDTWDGEDAVRSCTNSFSYTSIRTTVSGPTQTTMSFRYRTSFRRTSFLDYTIAEALTIRIDGDKVWSASPSGEPSPWYLGEVTIGAGTHHIEISHEQIGAVYALLGPIYAAWLDNVRFDALSRPPVLSPSTTDDESTAATFSGGSQTVSISAPGGDGTMIWYTTDGSDPETDGILYEGPFTVSESTRVRAIAVSPGLDRSVDTVGLYLHRPRPVRPGVWTADADGLTAAAAGDSSARLILGLYSSAAANSACADFRAVAEDPAFTSWCAANGVYLLRSDTTVYPDGVLAKSAIFDWFGGMTMYGPMLVAVTRDGETVKAKHASLSSGTTFGTKTYRGTVDSLIDCIAAIIGGTPPSAPTATPDGELVDGFPVSVALANPNSSGTLRYTLDGSAPTRSSTAYAGSALRIQNGQILSAAVFPSDASALSSPVLVRNYRTVPVFFGIPEDALDWSISPGSSAVPWYIYPTGKGPSLRSGALGWWADDPYVSSLQAVANASGTLSFLLGDTTVDDAATTVFTAPDGSRTVVRGDDETLIEWRSFSVAVKPGDVLLWSREVSNPGREDDKIVGFGYNYYPGAFLAKLAWTPGGEPPELGAVSVAATTTGATVSVPVSALGEGSSSVTVTVAVNGVERTQTLDAAGTATFVFSGLEPGTPYTAEITATGSNGGTATASEEFSTEALPSVGWFDVEWSSQRWGSGTSWRTADGEAAAGGTWTIPPGDASARNDSVLELALPEGGDLRFTAVSPSAGGGYVTVDGTLSPVPTPALPDLPAGAFAALSFARGGYKAWNGAQWIALSGAAPATSATTWTATFDFSSTPHRVRYAVGGKTLSASGSSWIPLASAPDYVRGVGYAGGGAVGDFKATYAGGIPVPVLATLAEGGVEPLVFGGTAAAPTLKVTIGNAQAGVWYAVYESASVDGPWTFVQRAHATRDGTLPFTIDATAATKFLRLKASEAEIATGDPLFR